MSSADNFCKTDWTQIKPDMTSGQIWIHSVLLLDAIYQRNFWKVGEQGWKQKDHKKYRPESSVDIYKQKVSMV